jgi:hypothetical protein
MAKKGITVGRKPLSEYLKQIEDRERDESILEHVNGVMIHHRRNIPYTRSQQYEDKTTTRKGSPRVSKRVRYLSREEIEEEYGMSIAGEKNKIKRLLYGLKTHGTLSSASAANIAGYTRRTAGTTLWRMAQAWPEHFSIDKTETPQAYTVDSQLRRKSVDELYEEYRAHCRSLYKSKKEPSPTSSSSDETPDDKEAIGVDFEVGDKMFQALVQATVDALRPQVMRLFQPTEQTKDLNLNINVTISFKLGG